MSKKSVKARKKLPAPRVRKIMLPAKGSVRVIIPEGVAPTIIADPAKSVVEIVPLPVKKTWWQSLFE